MRVKFRLHKYETERLESAAQTLILNKPGRVHNSDSVFHGMKNQTQTETKRGNEHIRRPCLANKSSFLLVCVHLFITG